MVKCVIFDGDPAQAATEHARSRISHVRDGQVLGAWRSTDGRAGYALLHVSSMTMVNSLLLAAFPGSRHIDVTEVLAVEPVESVAAPHSRPAASGE